MVVGLAMALLGACERTHVEQRGLRGLNIVQNSKPSEAAALAEANVVPKPLKKGNADGPRAEDYYENVQVLGDYSKSEFARTMASFKNWVAPGEGCGYCHNAPNYADDSKYTKRVAREMIRMTRHINSDWKQHVANTGVTCYTCHRGQPVPARIWFAPPTDNLKGFIATRGPMRLPTASAGTTGLPTDALAAFLLDHKEIRVIGPTALQTGNHRTIKQAKYTYAMMLVMAESLGVNCTYCHNTRAFYSWAESTPQRATAWYGIRMARDLNNTYMQSLVADLLPPERHGPAGDGPKIYCATCHQGVFKPLYGVSMVKDFPELIAPKTPDYVGGPRPPKPDDEEDAKPDAADGGDSDAKPGAAKPAAGKAAAGKSALHAAPQAQLAAAGSQ